MSSPAPPDRLLALEDRAALHDLLVRYATAVDERDHDALAGCFTDDAEASFAGIAAGAGGHSIATFLLSTLGPAESTHVVANVRVELRGDEAAVSSVAVVYGVRGEPEQLRLRGVTYRDVCVRTPNGWRIRERVHTPRWEGGAQHVPLTPIRSQTD